MELFRRRDGLAPIIPDEVKARVEKMGIDPSDLDWYAGRTLETSTTLPAAEERIAELQAKYRTHLKNRLLGRRDGELSSDTEVTIEPTE